MYCAGREWVPERRLLQLNASKKMSRWRLRSSVRFHKFTRKREWEEKSGKEMEEKNLKLYMENKCILEENKQLRKKALLLRQENLALLSEFQKKFSDELQNQFSKTI